MIRTQALVEALGGRVAGVAQKQQGEQCKEKPGYTGFESDKCPIKF